MCDKKDDEENLKELYEKQKIELEENKTEIMNLKKKSTTRNRTLEVLADTHKKNAQLEEKIKLIQTDFDKK